MESESKMITDMHKKAFTEEYKTLRSKKQLNKESRLLALNPFIDTDNIMRANTTLKYAECLPYDGRFPIILSRRMWVAKLIVRSYQIKDGHAAGTNYTLANLSQRFWLMLGREEIRQVEKECNTCKIRKAKAARQIMAPLPQIRLALPLQAF